MKFDWLGTLNPFAKNTPAPSQQADVQVGRLTAGQTNVGNVGNRVDPTLTVYRDARNTHTQDSSTYRYAKNADDLLMLLSKWDPDVSAGIWNFVRLADSGLHLVALDAEGRRSADLQAKLNDVLFRMSGLNDYKNWSIRSTIDLLVPMMVKYVVLRGALSSELVLNGQKFAQKLVVVDPITVSFVHPAPGAYLPQQTNVSGQVIKLDVPTFFWTLLDADADSPYETPPLLPAIQAVMFNVAFISDLERIVKRTAFPRITIKIIEATLRKYAPPECNMDEGKMNKWLNEQKAGIGEALSNLAPEDAAVFFDSMEIGQLETRGNYTVDYRPLKDVIDQRIITGLKSLPTILGRQFGSSQTIGGVETLIYANSVASVQNVVAFQLSQALTLALRLEGVAGSVKAWFDPVNLKPKNELEAYFSLKQARVLELLSYGFLSDEDAAEQLTGDATLPKTFQPLSGTKFYVKNHTVDAAAVAATRNPTASEQAGGGRQRSQ